MEIMTNALKFNLVILYFFFFLGGVFAGPKNIAPKAKVTSSSNLNDYFNAKNAIDGVIRIADKGEWACEGNGTFWGFIRYPWIQLDWDTLQNIDKIILYDRASLDIHTAGGRLKFSDGSVISVNALPNNGAAKVVTFESKKVDWVRFEVTDGIGLALGLSEIEVFPSSKSYEDLISWVNPFVETTRGRYFYFTPGALPFGMVATAPITRNKNQYGGGYNYNSMEILGFSPIHGWMMSGIQLMPTTGTIDPTLGEAHWKSSFSHDDELVHPGYQRVYLEDYDTWVEFTGTTRASIFRMTYTQSDQASILTNLGGYLGSTTMSGAAAKVVGDTKIEGSFDSGGRLWGGPTKVKVFFVMEFSKPFESVSGWNERGNQKSSSQIYGSKQMTRRDSMDYGVVVQSYWDAPTAGLTANYQVAAGDQILVKMAISYTSIENAWENLNTELDHWDFDLVQKNAEHEWNQILQRIEVKGGSDQQQIKFYTDLWHVLLGRKIINDVKGTYPDYTQGEKDWKFTKADLKIKMLPMNKSGKSLFNMYNSDALWLTHWNLNILWGLAWPEILDDFSASLVQYAKNGGLLPRGPNAGGYSYIMTGNPSTSLLVSTYQKGLMTKTSPKVAFDIMNKNHRPGGMMGDTPEELQFYIDFGYCPGNAGKTLEWSFQDWSLAQMAKKMGKLKDYNYFNNRAKTWTTLFRSGEHLIFPKDENGKWLHDDPLSMSGWVESNSWQGSWQVSHDIPTLSRLMGGNDTIASKLDYAFEKSKDDDFVFGYGNGYVSYANQPGCSNAHVFNYIGKPWMTQFWVREVNERAYGDITPESGYGGHDEDEGQMGGVSALMSMGLFSLRGNNSTAPIYELTSPVFDEVIIHLNKDYYRGETFKIVTENNGVENKYIQSVHLNGIALNKIWFYHSDFQKGGELRLKLGSEPNFNLGSNPSDAPYTNEPK
jgi:predicted alpha-1,2-mannosidase